MARKVCKETALETAGHVVGNDYCCGGIAVSRRLRHDHDIGLDFIVLDIEPLTAASKPCLSLIDNKEHAGLPGCRVKPLQIVFGREYHPAGGKYGFNNNRRNILQMLRNEFDRCIQASHFTRRKLLSDRTTITGRRDQLVLMC